MKVLFLIDTLEGYGAEKSIVQIATHMKEVKPVFVHLYRGDKLKSVLARNGIKVYSLNIEQTYGFQEAMDKISSIIEIEIPDVIHSTLFRSDMVARKLKKKFPGIPLVGSLVSNSYGKNRYSELSLLSKIKLFTTQFRDRWSSGKVDFFISNSNAIIGPNANALGLAKDKIQVIYRGRNFEDYLPNHQKLLKIKKELNLQTKKNIFINVARLTKSKGQLILIDAFKRVLEKYPESVLLLAGEGPLRSELKMKIESLKIDSSVMLLGYSENIPELLALSDYFVFPSYYEGLPGALIEAIIAQKPAIVSRIPENLECFPQDGALFFEPGQVASLTQKMVEAIEFDGWDQEILKSYQYAQKHFELNNISREYEKFYKKISYHNL